MTMQELLDQNNHLAEQYALSQSNLDYTTSQLVAANAIIDRKTKSFGILYKRAVVLENDNAELQTKYNALSEQHCKACRLLDQIIEDGIQTAPTPNWNKCELETCYKENNRLRETVDTLKRVHKSDENTLRRSNHKVTALSKEIAQLRVYMALNSTLGGEQLG